MHTVSICPPAQPPISILISNPHRYHGSFTTTKPRVRKCIHGHIRRARAKGGGWSRFDVYRIVGVYITSWTPELEALAILWTYTVVASASFKYFCTREQPQAHTTARHIYLAFALIMKIGGKSGAAAIRCRGKFEG